MSILEKSIISLFPKFKIVKPLCRIPEYCFLQMFHIFFSQACGFFFSRKFLLFIGKRYRPDIDTVAFYGFFHNKDCQNRSFSLHCQCKRAERKFGFFPQEGAIYVFRRTENTIGSHAEYFSVTKCTAHDEEV